MSIERRPSTFNERISSVIECAEYPRLESDFEIEDVLRLRYRAYRQENFIEEDPLWLCTDELDGLSNAFQYGVFIDGVLVSSLRVHVVSPSHPRSASASDFGDVLGPMLDNGAIFVDPSRFTIDPECSTPMRRYLPHVTLRLVVMACDFLRADYGLQIVRPEHQAFYRRTFFARPMSSVRNYPGLAFPVALSGSHTDTALPLIYRKYPFFRATYPLFARLYRGVEAVMPNAAAPESRSLVTDVWHPPTVGDSRQKSDVTSKVH